MISEADVIVIFDTDILIGYERKNLKAADLIDGADDRYISVQTYMEFLQGADSGTQLLTVKDFMARLDFHILPFTENIGHRACIYIEEYALSAGMRPTDAIIAATAVENNLTLVSGNHKHFKPIRELKLKPFSP